MMFDTIVLPSLETWLGLLIPSRIMDFAGPILSDSIYLTFTAYFVWEVFRQLFSLRFTIWVLIVTGLVGIPLYLAYEEFTAWMADGTRQEWRNADKAVAASAQYTSAEEAQVRQSMLNSIYQHGPYTSTFSQNEAYLKIPDICKVRDKMLFALKQQLENHQITWWEYRREIDHLNVEDGPVAQMQTMYIPQMTWRIMGYSALLLLIVLKMMSAGALQFRSVNRMKWECQRRSLELKLARLPIVQVLNYTKRGGYLGAYELKWPYIKIQDIKLVVAESKWDAGNPQILYLPTGTALKFMRSAGDAQTIYGR